LDGRIAKTISEKVRPGERRKLESMANRRRKLFDAYEEVRSEQHSRREAARVG
jgi:hypothetical protein